jgi:hypothetical protein
VVRYAIHGSTRDVVDCHCGQCLRFHGHYGAYTSTARGNLQLLVQDSLLWYQSSPEVRRGFCGRCGSSLFWDRSGLVSISIAAGSLDQPTGLQTVGHIFTEHLADYYQITDRLEKRPRGLRD